jgi:hypothetical protein
MRFNAFLYLYVRRSYFDEDLTILRAHGWGHVALDASHWQDGDAMDDAFATAFGFPEYYGRNFNALLDCMRGTAAGGEMTEVEFHPPGGVLTIARLDAFAHRQPSLAQGMCEVLATWCLENLINGRPRLVLAQSDDPDLLIEPAASSVACWNPREWATATRQP